MKTNSGAQGSKQTPKSLGYRMPPEWARHEATWMSWPRRDGISFPGAYEAVTPIFAKMIGELVQHERVCLNVRDTAMEAEARKALGAETAAGVRFFHVATDEPWCRDHGPSFVVRQEEPELAIVNWGYNAWGGKYPPYDSDNAVPSHVAKHLGLPLFEPGMVLEGGAIDVNGAGAVLTTESCLLNPNRNPTLDKANIEARLREFLNVDDVLWLGDGIEGDDTDGHIDDLTRFVGHRCVVTVVEDDPADANYEPLKENRERLRHLRLRSGDSLEVHDLPMPPRMMRDGMRLPASYANFYIANGIVLLPVFNHPKDAQAIEVLERVFRDRRVVPIEAVELIWGLGAVHCLTQQQPAAGRYATG